MIKGKCGIDKKAFEILLWYSFPLDCSWAFVALWAHQGAFKIEKVLLALNCGVSLTKGRHFCKHQERRPICLNSGRKQPRGFLSNCCFCCFFLYFFGGKIDLGGFTSDDLWYHEAIGLTPFPDFRTTREALWGVVIKSALSMSDPILDHLTEVHVHHVQHIHVRHVHAIAMSGIGCVA